MKIDKTQNENLAFDDLLARGIVIFPENENELKLIEYILEEGLNTFKEKLELDSKHKIYE